MFYYYVLNVSLTGGSELTAITLCNCTLQLIQCCLITGSYDEHILKTILKTKEDSGVRHSRRGHNFMLRTQTYKTKYRKTNIWNKLPHHVVNASSLNSCKNSVDRYFISSNMYYDYKFKPEAEQQLWKQDSSDHIGREG